MYVFSIIINHINSYTYIFLNLVIFFFYIVDRRWCIGIFFSNWEKKNKKTNKNLILMWQMKNEKKQQPIRHRKCCVCFIFPSLEVLSFFAFASLHLLCIYFQFATLFLSLSRSLALVISCFFPSLYVCRLSPRLLRSPLNLTLKQHFIHTI